MPSQVRLSAGAPLPDSDTAFYYLLENPTAKPALSASPLLQAEKPDKSQLTVKQSKQQALAGIQHKDSGLPDTRGPTANCKSQSTQGDKADKENFLMGLHIPRFNTIEARHRHFPAWSVLKHWSLTATSLMQRAFVLAVKAKLTREAYKFMVSA